MKKSKRYIKKEIKKSLINKKVLSNIIANSNICQHAIRELKLAGYGKEKGGLNCWMYQQVLEAVAVFSSHDNSGFSASYEIDLVKKLCNWDIISPLTFKADEWGTIALDGTCQNKRKSSIFKYPDGSICDIDAFSKKPVGTYCFNTKIWEENNDGITWHGGLFEHKDNILTGRYFHRCYIKHYEIVKGYTPKPKRIIPCVEVEVAPDDWLMAVAADSSELLLLDCDYDIKWEECPCLKGIRLEYVTPELGNKAFEELKNNKH